jgi:uncharacterized protein YmfQ (DUF2313 family)
VSIAEKGFVGQLQALLPPGKLWSRSVASLITAAFEGIAPEFARVQERADQLELEMNPGTATELLPEHESTNGITPVAGATIAQRRAALLAKLQETSGHNPADYAAFAAAFGYPGTQVVRMPLPPLRMGSRVGDRLRGEGWAHAYFLAYMTQLLTEQPNDLNAWARAGGVTAAANTGTAPDGTLTADRVSFTSGTGVLSCALSSPASPVQFSVWLRTPTGTGTRVITLSVRSPSSSVNRTVLVQEQWTRFETLRNPLAGANSVALTPVTTGDVLAWGAYAGSPNASFEAAFLNRQQAHSVPLFRAVGDVQKG